jgi:hypothetical protein
LFLNGTGDRRRGGSRNKNKIFPDIRNLERAMNDIKTPSQTPSVEQLDVVQTLGAS